MNDFGSKAEQGFLALLGDVVRSRELSGRGALQRRLRSLLEELGEELGEGVLAAPLELTAGDEIQGLFRRGEGAVVVIRVLADELRPVRVAYGLGYGGLSTDLAERPTWMDGPCFHRARVALERARKERRWVVAEGFGEPWDGALTALFRLMDAIRSRWTDRQAAYARAARHAARRLDVARAFSVSPSVVSESLKAASFRDVLAGERAVEELLARLMLAGGPAGGAG